MLGDLPIRFPTPALTDPEEDGKGGLEGVVVFPVHAVLREHQQQAVVDLGGPVISM